MLDVLHPGHPDRQDTEVFIQAVFARQYDADIRHFMPHMVRLSYDDSGELYSAVGYREAADGPLFLEHYLDSPVETAMAHAMEQPVSRNDIVEVGNLAEVGPGGARDAIIALTAYLYGAGYHWVAITAVPRLVNAFQRIGLRTVYLADADIMRLPESERSLWGRYYDNRPKVVGGDIRLGYRALEAMKHELPEGCCELMNVGRNLGMAWARQHGVNA